MYLTSTVVHAHHAAGPISSCSWVPQVIKDMLDKKFGGPWHVVAGSYFSYEITHECKTLLYLFINGKIGVLTWKL